MSFAREKRLLLGLAAALAPLPLPFNQVISWAALALFLAALALFLRRAWQGSERWLAAWAQNALGLAYLPVLAIDIASVGTFQAIRPVLHLALFVLVVKLCALAREADKWQATIGIFFLFLAAMATSVHPSIVVYLVVFLALVLALLVRFAYLHLLASFGHRELPQVRVPLLRFVAAAALATLAVAAPLFALLPRVRDPFIYGPGGAADLGGRAAGFSDEMSLDQIGRLRDNPQVAFRLRFEAGGVRRPSELRFKAATYERYQGRSWERSPTRSGSLRRAPGEVTFRLAAEAPSARAEISLEPLGATSLPLPVEAVGVELEVPALGLDRGGAAVLPSVPARRLDYRVELARTARLLALEPESAESGEATLDRSGLSPEIERLAATLAGTGDAALRAAAIEALLQRDWQYSDAGVGRGGADPIADFLLRDRRGHCEHFASAMVLLLRAQGIPARLVTGFLGAEKSFWEEAYVVRQSAAHAWVEAYLPGGGWTTFDPTPPGGRPEISAAGALLYLRQAWESIVFRWDRYVLSYDFDDQVRALGGLRDLLARLWHDLTRRPGSEQGPFGARPVAEAAGAEPPDPAAEELWRGRLVWTASGLGLLAAAAVAWLGWRRRPRWSASAAYRDLRRRLAQEGQPVSAALAPLALVAAVAERFPGLAGEARAVVDAYLSEAYAGRPLAAPALAQLRARARRLERSLHLEARRRRRARRP